MRYIIKRASDWSSMPCRDCEYVIVRELVKAHGEECPERMKRNCKDIHKEGKLWVGTLIEPVKKWVKEIESLTEFVEKNGRIILEKSDYLEYPFEIIIYDDYME